MILQLFRQFPLQPGRHISADRAGIAFSAGVQVPGPACHDGGSYDIQHYD